MKKTSKPATAASSVARGESKTKAKSLPAPAITKPIGAAKSPVASRPIQKVTSAEEIIRSAMKNAPLALQKATAKVLLKPKAQPVAPSRTVAKAAIPVTVSKVAPRKQSVGKTVTPQPVTPKPAKSKAVAGKASPVQSDKKVLPTTVPINKAAPIAKSETKAKRARVPVDLAAQYGERVNEKAASRVVSETKARRPRRNAAARARLQEVLRPDESVVERLARLHSAGATKPRALTRRSKHWETRCGKCGTSGKFAGAATLCARCGTILIRAD